MSERYDLILTGGKVIDPAQNIAAHRDVAIKDGKIAEVSQVIPEEKARIVEDVRGKVVTPGLIDIHGHYFYGIRPQYVKPDEVCPPAGVTTVADGGSAGWLNFQGFKEYIIGNSQTRVYAFLNISEYGLLPYCFNGELVDVGMANVGSAVECINNNRKDILGVKIRLDYRTTGVQNAAPALELAIKAAEQSGTRITAHVANTPLPMPRVLESLRPGDVVSHIFHGHENNILDWDRKVLPEVWEGARRGIYYDVCMTGGISFRIARAAMEQGLLPQCISSDMAKISNVPRTAGMVAYTLPEILSIFMKLGMSLEQVIACATSQAARAIGKADEMGSLKVGTEADIAVFKIEEGEFTFFDQYRNAVQAGQRITPVLTVRRGKVVWREGKGG